MNLLASVLAYLGAVLCVAMVLPQVTRTVRYPALPGVSSAFWALSALACLAWMAYGIRADVMPQIPGNTLMLLGSLAVVLLVPSRWSRPRRAALLFAFGACFVGLAAAIPPAAIGYLATVLGLVSVWPQLADSYRNWRGGVESGVSLTGWGIRLAATGSWLTYSVIALDVPVLIASIAGAAANIAVFWLESAARQRARLLGASARLDLLREVAA